MSMFLYSTLGVECRNILTRNKATKRLPLLITSHTTLNTKCDDNHSEITHSADISYRSNTVLEIQISYNNLRESNLYHR